MQLIHWQPIHSISPSAFPNSLIKWISNSGSFIERLKQAGVQAPQIEVISQRWEIPYLEERIELNIPPRQYGFVREVLISSPEGKWMFARTVFPSMTLQGPEKIFKHIKTRSLGSVLFKNHFVDRSDFEVKLITNNANHHQKISEIVDINEDIWARRSLFFLKQKKLLLTEFFLPDIQLLLEP